MEEYTEDEVRCAEVGKLLGRMVRQHFAATFDEFVALVATPPRPLLPLVLQVAYLRTPFRIRGGGSLLEELEREPRLRVMESLLQDAWAVYRSLRQHACPRAQQPVVRDEDVPLPFTREVGRWLRRTGVRPEHEEWRGTVRHALANQRLVELWGEMEGRHCVLWYDNFYKRLYRATPRDPMVSLNSTVMAVMRPRGEAYPAFPGYPSLEQLWRRHQDVAEELCELATGRLPALIEDVGMEPLQADEFRIPLDLPRSQARSPVWRAFSLSQDVVSSQVGMLRVLRFLRDEVLPHVRAPMPLLVDINLWYRQLKLVYGREAQRWSIGDALEGLPPLFGIWHPYKQVLTVLYRRLLPLFVFVQKGTVESLASVMEKPKLRTLECWIGALLMLPKDRRVRVREQLDRLRRRSEELQGEVAVRDSKVMRARQWLDVAVEKAAKLRSMVAKGHVREQENLRRAEGLLQHNQDTWNEATEKRMRASAELRAVRRDREVLQALYDLITAWAPACFALGWRIRDCHWEHRAPMTGSYALEALRTSLLLLYYLETPTGSAAQRSTPQTEAGSQASAAGIAAEDPMAATFGSVASKGAVSDYVRSLSCALMLWTPWHDCLPACCYSEELTEASLSRLGRSMKKHADATTAEAVMDLWLRVRPGSVGYKKIKAGGVDAAWQRMVLQHVDDLLLRCESSPGGGPSERVSDIVRYVAKSRRAGRREPATGEAAIPTGAEEADEGDAYGEVQSQWSWPENWFGPPCPTRVRLDALQPDLEAVLKRSLVTLLRDSLPTEEVVQEIEALCSRRDEETVLQYHTAWDLFTGRPPTGAASRGVQGCPEAQAVRCPCVVGKVF